MQLTKLFPSNSLKAICHMQFVWSIRVFYVRIVVCIALVSLGGKINGGDH